MKWRREVIYSVFGVEPSQNLLVENRRYYCKHIEDGSHVAVVASVDGEDVGCGAVCFLDELPSPDNPMGRCAYLMNIYVRIPYRNHGFAHAIVRRLIELAHDRQCGKIYLETTDMGQSLYRSLDFEEMKGMMKLSADFSTNLIQ